jgi:hypothetical protein
MTDDMDWTTRDLDYEPPYVDTSIPHTARIYDYVLGGKDNYPPDREAAEQMLKEWPSLRTSMRQNRQFMRRVTRYLAAERGIEQFLDIGTGIPTSPNLHEVAQDINPKARVLYVDNDPIVLAHAQARLTGTPEGRIAYLHADMRDTDTVLNSPDLRATLDLDRPVALTIIAALQTITDEQQAHDLVDSYLRPLPAGSFFALSTVTVDSSLPEVRAVVAEYRARGIPTRDRNKAEVTAFFDGLDLIDPGVVLVHRWRPDKTTSGVVDSDIAMYGGVALKSRARQEMPSR